jgi:hypothetical protein
VLPSVCVGIVKLMSDKAQDRESHGKPLRTRSAIGAAGLTVCLGGGLAHNVEPLPHVTVAPVAKEWTVPTPGHQDESAAPVSLKIDAGNSAQASATRPTTSIVEVTKLLEEFEG